MKKVSIILALAVFSFLGSLNLNAEVWIMILESPGGWTMENETISISYDYKMNPIGFNVWNGNIENCQPEISAKIKNNSDDFIYLDLAKTYILRNGEAELYQNIVTMSTSKDANDADATKKSMSQSMMPIPPHASKTLMFPLYNSAGEISGYEAFMKGFIYYGAKTKYYASTRYSKEKDNSSRQGTVNDYTQINSPLIATISIAYSNTEDGEKATRVTKEFYVGEAVKSKNASKKNLDKVLPNLEGKSYFVVPESR